MQVSFIRRIDELGRIVIPKEIRNKLKIASGDLLDLIVNNDSLMIRKSFSLLNLNYVEEIINLVEYLSDYDLILTNCDSVVAKGSKLNDLNVNDKISSSLKELVLDNKSKVFQNGVNISDNFYLSGNVYVKVLIKESNTIGLLILKTNSGKDINLFLNTLVKLLLE